MDKYDDLGATPLSEAFAGPLYGHDGHYLLRGDTRVPYVSVLMRLDQLALLKTMEDMDPDLNKRWRFKEVFQREINKDRVRQEIVDGYLRRKDKLKFFNAITVVLFPSEEGHIVERFEGQEAVPEFGAQGLEAFFSKHGKRTIFGGVDLSRSEDGLARIAWNTTTVKAIPVDGQHRLSALTELVSKKELTDPQLGSRVPVIFVLLDERAGYKGTPNLQSVTDAARELFTDLNKHAKAIDKAREIVLDDLSIEACCVRELVSTETARKEEGRLPLGAVTWQTPTVKFDTGTAVNTILHLYKLVSELAAIKYPKDLMDRKEVKAFVSSYETFTGHPKAIVSGYGTLDQHLNSQYLKGLSPDQDLNVPFELPTEFVHAAVERFVERHKPWLMRVLAEFGPYSRVLEALDREGMLDGDAAKFYSQTTDHRRRLIDNKDISKAAVDSFDAAGEEIERTLKKRQWAFYAIFQQALVQAAGRISIDFNHFEWGGIDAFMRFLAWCDGHQYGILAPHAEFPEGATHNSQSCYIWDGLARNPAGQTIKQSSASTSHIRSLILALYVQWYYSVDHEFNLGEFRAGSLESDDAKAAYDLYKECLGKPKRAAAGKPPKKPTPGTVMSGLQNKQIWSEKQASDQVALNRNTEKRAIAIFDHCLERTVNT